MNGVDIPIPPPTPSRKGRGNNGNCEQKRSTINRQRSMVNGFMNCGMRIGLCAALMLGVSLRADDEVKKDEKGEIIAGHSTHGDAFNEGPRQKAYLMEGMPKVHFAVSTKDELAQKFFDQGVGQLHGFWYFEAERSFRQVAAIDKDCAMAYWGMAMANINNAKRAGEFIKQAQERKKFANARETKWIDGLAAFYQNKKDEKERRKDLVKALEAINFDFPDDIEAKAFLVFQIYDNSQHGIPVPSVLAFNALANEVLAANPIHPVHHYRIHMWDHEKSERALNSAAMCGPSGPGIAHLWHMPGHTYSDLKRYSDAAWQQEASARTDHAQMMRDKLLPDQIHNYAHNNDWLVQNLSYIGRVHDAIDLAKNMIELPRLPKFSGPLSTNGVRRYDQGGSSYAMGRTKLYDVLKRWELWEELADLSATAYFDPGEQVEDRARFMGNFGDALFMRGDKKKGAEQLAALETLMQQTKDEQKKSGETAEAKAKEEKKPEDQIKKAKEEATKTFDAKIKALDKALDEVKVYKALTDKNIDELKHALDHAGEMSNERKSQLWFEAGDKEKCEKFAREGSEKGPGQIHAQANYADILSKLGKKKEALEQFEKVRAISAYADLDMPIFKRIQPLAKELKLSSDWRIAAKSANDTGERPPLAYLGPFRWQPTAAPDFTLPDADGKSLGLKKFRGKPVVVIFYLGKGCPHCMEQLNVFAPMAKDFADAGISLIAISMDSISDARKTYVKGKDGEPFPFPLLSDENLGAFKAYRVFDDFEKIALHGTFLIDGAGLVRWQDISFDPFREPRFLLEESKRLLSLPRDKKLSKNDKKEEKERYLP
jgi:peroxiredoxin